MGREATAICAWNGQNGTVKALLESRELILRGDVRARVARADISAVSTEGDALILDIRGAPLTLSLGATEAAKWQAAILKPLPTLAEKLGIDAKRPAFVVGSVVDPELVAALVGATTETLPNAVALISILEDETDLQTTLDLSMSAPHIPVWCIYPKGKSANPSDSTVRAFMRANGYMDNKTSAVSERLTATRYARRG